MATSLLSSSTTTFSGPVVISSSSSLCGNVEFLPEQEGLMASIRTKMERILLRLNCPRTLIEDTLQMRPKPSQVLLSKLTNIEHYIEAIPLADIVQAFEDWRQMVLLIWAKHVEANVKKPSTTFSGTSTSTSTPDRQSPDITFANGELFNQAGLPTRSSPDAVEYSDHVLLVKNAIRAGLVHVDRLHSSADVTGVKKLLQVLGQAVNLLEPFQGLTQLQSDVFGSFIVKFPADMVRMFYSRADRPRTIEELRIFVQDELTKLYVKSSSKPNAAAAAIASPKVSRTSLASTREPLCYACFKPGHRAAECTESVHGPPPSFEAISACLRRAFAAFEPVALATDLEGLKRLLLLITKARGLLMAHHRNSRFQEEMFGIAFIKLPVVMRGQFIEIYGAKEKNFRELRRFLEDEILGYAAGRNIRRTMELGSKAVAMMCTYCHKIGHTSHDCEERHARLCLRCMSFGHRFGVCRAEVVHIQLEDFN